MPAPPSPQRALGSWPTTATPPPSPFPTEASLLCLPSRLKSVRVALPLSLAIRPPAPQLPAMSSSPLCSCPPTPMLTHRCLLLAVVVPCPCAIVLLSATLPALRVLWSYSFVDLRALRLFVLSHLRLLQPGRRASVIPKPPRRLCEEQLRVPTADLLSAGAIAATQGIPTYPSTQADPSSWRRHRPRGRDSSVHFAGLRRATLAPIG